LTLSADCECFANLLEILEHEIVIDSLKNNIKNFFDININEENSNLNNMINILLITLHYSILEHHDFLIWIKSLLESSFKNEISLVQTFTTSTEIYDSLKYEKRKRLNFVGIIWLSVNIALKTYESNNISKEMFLFIHLFKDAVENEFNEVKFKEKAIQFIKTFLNKEFNWIYVPFFNLIKFVDMFKISPEPIISALVNTDDKIDSIEIFAETLEKFIDMEAVNTMQGQAFLFGTSLDNTKRIEKSLVDLHLFMKIAMYLKIEFDEGEKFIARIGKEKTVETIIKLISHNSGDSLCFYMKPI
ncbi:MAG: hypothetical protein HQK78_19595, partial [Desulfobacterales bacterium]|nr:hypothetical protein [Desulfobacterales bacterium]